MSPPIYTPDGSEVSEIVLPDGSTASQVIGPDGNVVFEAGPDIPDDKLVHRYPTEGFTTSNWPDSVGTSDIDDISGLTLDSDAFGGDGGVVGDGSSYGLSDTMGSYGSNLTTPHAIAFRFSTTDTGGILISVDQGGTNNFVLMIGTQGFEGADDTKLSYFVRDIDGNRNVVQTNQDVTDGGDYPVIIQREASGGDASDIQIYVGDATSSEQDIVQNESYSNVEDFIVDVAYYARNRQNITSPDFRINATMREPFWFDDSLNESERSAVFSEL